MAFLRSKLTLVVLGALLLGSAAALLGAVSAERPADSPPLAASSATAGSTSTGSAATATNGGSPTGGPGASPTSTLAPSPTATRVPPTPTPVPVPGQQYTFHGSIASGSINPATNTFVLNVRGGSYTIQVMSGATITLNNQTATFSQLASGMRADVTGVYQGGGNLNANIVDAQSGDN